MSERTIIIPYEEYKELQTFKEIAQKSEDRVFVKNETFSYGNHYNWWEVYTKDDYIKSILQELNEYKKKEQEAEIPEDSELNVPYKPLFWFIFFLLLIYVILQVIFK